MEVQVWGATEARCLLYHNIRGDMRWGWDRYLLPFSDCWRWSPGNSGSTRFLGMHIMSGQQLPGTAIPEMSVVMQQFHKYFGRINVRMLGVPAVVFACFQSCCGSKKLTRSCVSIFLSCFRSDIPLRSVDLCLRLVSTANEQHFFRVQDQNSQYCYLPKGVMHITLPWKFENASYLRHCCAVDQPHVVLLLSMHLQIPFTGQYYID